MIIINCLVYIGKIRLSKSKKYLISVISPIKVNYLDGLIYKRGGGLRTLNKLRIRAT